jgi:hypothetical protein
MTAAQWFYGGFFFAWGALLGYAVLYVSMGVCAFTYGFIKGVFR